MAKITIPKRNMKKSQKVVRKRAETKEKILEAAREVFAEKGFRNANIDEIGKRAKVDRASVYYYIGDKQEVYSEVIARSLNKTVEKLIRDEAIGDSPEEKLRQYINFWIPKGDRVPNDAMIYFWEFAAGGENITEAHQESFSKFVDIFLDIIDEGIKAGEFKPVNPYILHMMIAGALMMWATTNAPKSKLVSEKWLEKHSQYLINDVAEEIEWLVLQLIKKS